MGKRKYKRKSKQVGGFFQGKNEQRGKGIIYKRRKKRNGQSQIGFGLNPRKEYQLRMRCGKRSAPPWPGVADYYHV